MQEINYQNNSSHSKSFIDDFKKISPSLTKYLPFLPINNPCQFNLLSNSATPLIKSKNIGPSLDIDLYFKLENKNPTGSFKDRGSAVEIAVAEQSGAKAIVLASTGNMAASCACYAADQLPCYVFVPKTATMNKLAQAIAFGATIIRVDGDYNDAAKLAELSAKKFGFYLAGNYANRLEGQKTAAFELIDQMDETPDGVVIPMGCGTNLAAYAKGFNEYQQLGLLKQMPKLIGVQATGASAIVNSFKKNLQTVHATNTCQTIASAIAVANPNDGAKALAAIYQSGGYAVAVTDDKLVQMQYRLCQQENIFVESASAATVAGLIDYVQSTKIKNHKIVCVLTGDGLKDPQSILNTVSEMQPISPTLNNVKCIFEGVRI